jgi:hypothetical protein
VWARSTDSELLLGRCREVLLVVLGYGESGWPPLATWHLVLPSWFVQACGPEQTAEEAARWLAWWKSLPPDEQAAVADEQPWALSDWLHWFEPDQRFWYWLGADASDPRLLRIWLDTPGSPAPTGSLEWLLKAAGAAEVETT